MRYRGRTVDASQAEYDGAAHDRRLVQIAHDDPAKLTIKKEESLRAEFFRLIAYLAEFLPPPENATPAAGGPRARIHVSVRNPGRQSEAPKGGGLSR